jgi:hypothetical protein
MDTLNFKHCLPGADEFCETKFNLMQLLPAVNDQLSFTNDQ